MTHGMEEFFTRERANDGIEVPLYLPSGEKSEHWIRIRGVDSDHFREAEAESRRKAVKVAAIEDPAEQRRAIAKAKIELIAHLVISWSFGEECEYEAVVGFLKQAPQIADAIDRVASHRALFFAKGSSSSQPSPNTNSSSTAIRKDQGKVSEPV